MNRILSGALGATAFVQVAFSLFNPLPALAHATLAVTEATPGRAYRGVVRIGHGCDGSPTTRLTVRLPEGVIDVKPMPKPGWTLETRRAAYARTYTLWGKPVADGVTEITWTGRLDDAHYDEFTFVSRIADTLAPGSTLPIPVVQGCEQGLVNWVEVAKPGEDAHALKAPAPTVRLVAGDAPAVRAEASAVKAGDLVIEGAWARATPGGAKVAGGYLRVRNEGAQADRLVGTAIPLAKRGEVHEMSTEGGIMRMRPLENGIPIPPGGTVELKPGGLHLMFLDLEGGLKEGQTIAGTVTFERAGTVPVAFRVGGIGAQGPGAGEHQHH